MNKSVTRRLLAIVAGVATLAALGGTATVLAASRQAAAAACAPSGSAVTRIKMTPQPIAQFGSLQAGQSAPFAAQALNGLNCVAGAQIALNVSVGPGTVFVSPSMCGGATQLGSTSTVCTTDSTGRVAMTLTTPSSIPPTGSIEVNAQAGSVAGHVWYVYAYIYRFSVSPIASSGSLSVGKSVPVTLQVAGVDGTPTVGVGVFLSLGSTASPHGTVMALGSQLTSSPQRFTTDSNGQIQLTYTAPNSPQSSGIDTIFAASTLSTPQVTNSTAYAFAPGYPTLSVGDVAQVDGDNHPNIVAEFDVSLSAPQSSPVTVQYTTVCGIGDKGCREDILQTLRTKPGTITIPAGQVRGVIPVTVYSYPAPEPYTETFFVQLASPGGAILGRSLGLGAILGDDETTLAKILYVGDTTVVRSTSGNQLAEFTVTLSTPSASPVSFDYATTDLTAVAGFDYSAESGTATIAAGLTSLHIEVPILPSSRPGAPTFNVTISNPNGATIERATGTGTLA